VSGWGGGYVTDVTYVPGYYRQQSPLLMTLACLLGGVAPPLHAGDDPVSYLELGCGQGFGALVLAASNPHWTVTAVDFNPAHIAEARAWAEEAGIDNVRFLEADLATLTEDPILAQVPEADFVSMHGVWTWVPSEARSGIVRLLRAKVRAGGAVHVSYNALPAWGSALGMQRVVHDCGVRLATVSDSRAVEGLKLAKELQSAGALQLTRSSLAMSLLSRFENMPGPYLAHEYMHDSFSPCFHADLVAALTDAKLEWVGSVNLTENFPDLTLTPEQRALVQRFDDPLLRELLKDMCLERSLRHDLFVRGTRRMAPAERHAALMDVWLALNIRPEDMPYEAEMPAGRAALNRSFYGPIAEAMAAGPRRVGDLLAIPHVEGRRDNPAELIGLLVGLDLAEPAARPGAEPAMQARNLNRVAAARLSRTGQLGRPAAAASLALGAGAPCSLIDLYTIERMRAGGGDVRIEEWLRDLGAEPDGEVGTTLREAFERAVQVKLPILRTQGVY
jgi:SAM-dependent methyltransferase